jgi:uncharacterized surface protein with fasciclin (FAS1) repeats
MKKNVLSIPALLLSGLALFSSCSKDDPAPAGPQSIFDIVNTSADFTTLKAVVIKGGLVQTLQQISNATVFAPDNAAFTASGINLAQVDSATARAVVLYHVLGQRVAASAVTTAAVPTANTKNLYTAKVGANVFVNGFRVKTADVNASNGVIHVIDNVLIPPSLTLVQVASSPGFERLLQAVVKAGLAATVTNATDAAPLTVFAPDNAAFAAASLDSATIAGLPQSAAAGVVGLHVIAGSRVFSPQLSAGTVTTAAGPNTLTVQVSPAPGVRAASSTGAFSLVRTTKQGTSFDIVCTNGVIHVIDRTIRP